MPHPELARRFNDGIRDEAAYRFGVDPEGLESLSAFENFVYECTSPDGAEIILRVSHSARRTLDYTLGEVDFVRYLAAAGLPVSKPVLAESGQFAERIEDRENGHYFVATAFERAAGYVFDDAPPLRERYWNATLFRELGRLFARLHARAQSYRPPNPRLKRQEWHEYDVVDVDRFAPREETQVRARTAAIVARLNRLPRDKDGYGLIHADLHPHNFCFDEGRVTVFDFDNSEYAWFVKDIAVILFYVARAEEASLRDEAAAAFLGPFLEGYREIRPCDRGWLEAVPDLLALQRSMNYALFHQYRDPENVTDAERDGWRRFRRDIEAEVPVLKLDFGRF
jgi:Ser/Thr protein kinase RdoA (MazF antagonist)